MSATSEKRNRLIIAAMLAIPALLAMGAAAPATTVREGRSPIEFHLMPGTRVSPPSLGILLPGDGSEPVLLTLQAVGQQAGALADPVVGVQISIPWSAANHRALRQSTPLYPTAPVWTVGNFGFF
jgi:hypothetical protein